MTRPVSSYKIPHPDTASHQAAIARQNTLTKPAGSLGKLETIACQFAAWQGKVQPDSLRPSITIFAGDHGVTEEGVSAYPSVVTGEMVKNFAAGGAAICVLARQQNIPLAVVDVGVCSPIDHLPIIHAKVRAGTRNLAVEAAMTTDEATQAINVGRQIARQAIEAGANLLVAGEMGIGNTTPSAALICHFTGADIAQVTGRGTGLDDYQLAHKCTVIARALKRLQGKEYSATDILQEIGGFEIAAIAGYYLEGAQQGIPSLVDGVISCAGAIVAQAIAPEVSHWLIASHRSEEPGHIIALTHLGLSPLIELNMRLGEGSGAATCIPLLQLAIALHNQMATFGEAGVSEKSE